MLKIQVHGWFYKYMADQNNFEPSQMANIPEGYRRPLGLWIEQASVNELNKFGLPPILGPVVKRVTANSAADLAGIIGGDMILRINGTAVDALRGSSTDLLKAVSQCLQLCSSDAVIVFDIRRNDQEIVIKVSL